MLNNLNKHFFLLQCTHIELYCFIKKESWLTQHTLYYFKSIPVGIMPLSLFFTILNKTKKHNGTNITCTRILSRFRNSF